MSIKPPITTPKTDRDFVAWCRDTGDAHFIDGTGDPNGVYTANRGKIFVRLDGVAGSLLYAKSTDGVATGWVAFA